MKLPNFRLYETQATASIAIAALGGLGIVALAAVVFRHFNLENMVIIYDPQNGIGQYRPYMVYGFSAVTVVLGGISGLLGFNSLGQKRNKLQGRSWLGMTLGAVCISIVPVLFFVWKSFSEPIIHAN